MTITERASQLLNDPEYGYELNWDKAVRIAREEEEEKLAAQQEQARKRVLWAQYKAELAAAGVTGEAFKNFTSKEYFNDLPEMIAYGQIRFTTKAKEIAVEAAIRKLWLAIGYGEPRFNKADYVNIGVGSLSFAG